MLYITGDGEELSKWRIIANLALHDDKLSGSSDAKLSLGIKMISPPPFFGRLCVSQWWFQISGVKSEILRRHKAQLFLDLIIWYHCAADASSIKFMFRSSFATRGLNQNLFSPIPINLFHPQGSADYYFAVPVITDTFLEYSPTFRSESHSKAELCTFVQFECNCWDVLKMITSQPCVPVHHLKLPHLCK